MVSASEIACMHAGCWPDHNIINDIQFVVIAIADGVDENSYCTAHPNLA